MPPRISFISEKKVENSLMEFRRSFIPPSGLLSPLALVPAADVALPVQALTAGDLAEIDDPFRGGEFLLEMGKGGKPRDPWLSDQKRAWPC